MIDLIREYICFKLMDLALWIAPKEVELALARGVLAELPKIFRKREL